MQESLVKLVLLLVAAASLAVGGVLLVIPASFVTLAEVDVAGTSWLRGIGGSVAGIQGIGLFLATFRRRDTNPLVGIAALSTTFEAGALWYSLVTGEFAEANSLVVIVAGVLASAAAVLLWFVLSARRSSRETMPQKSRGKKSKSRGDTARLEELEEPPKPPADLAAEIDAQSPRFKE